MSLIDIEKNDVDISQLFTYKKEITLLVPGTTDEITLHQRIIGDSDNNKARVYALRESGKLRENLRNTKWEDRSAYLPSVDNLKKDDIVDLVLSLSIQEITLDAINKVDVPEPKEPKGDASLEDQEKHQKEVDAYKDKFNKAVNELLSTKLEERRKELNKNLKDDLIRTYETTVIDQLCQKRFLECYIEMCTFYGTYSDSGFTKRSFNAFEDFQNSPTQLKSRLMDGYSDLQVGGAALKKLQGVTQ